MNIARQQKQFAVIKKRDEAYEAICAREAHQQEVIAAARRLEIERLARIETTRAQSVQNAAAVFGTGYLGYGNGFTETKPSRILYPKERKRPRRHLREIVFTRQVLRDVANLEEVLVPVRLDIDYDKYKLRDTFTYNLNDTSIPVELFAEHLCEDYRLPQAGFAAEVQKSLKAQLADHHPHRFSEEQEGNTLETTQQASEVYTDTRDDDLRISIKLDITLGTFNLIDQFEWDINNSQNDAERFARHFCSELGLATEFVTAIAHAIREQCQMYTKSLFLVGHTFDGRGVHDNDVRQLVMPSLFASLRPKHMMDRFAPALYELTPDQLERIERERERDGRRNRRQTRGKRGANLPDLTDIPKTYRSPYANRVLVADEDSWADKFTTVRAAVPATATEFEELSDIDEEKHPDRDSPMTDRGMRGLRGHKGASTGSTLQHTKPRSYAPPPHYSEQAPVYHRAPSAAVILPTREHYIPPPHRPDAYTPLHAAPAHLLARNNVKLASPSPEPSLIVRLKVPKLRQFLGHPQNAAMPILNQQRSASYDQSRFQFSESSPIQANTVLARSDLPQGTKDHVQRLHASFPYDRFEPFMKPDPQSGELVARIRCLTCPGVLYYVNDFDVHLRNRTHRMRVEQGLTASVPVL